jgi:AcrR family transcriptional regulator
MDKGLQRRADLNNETVVRLMNAAVELFAEFGHENVSLRQLTSLAGVNVASVNYYFGSKEALTEAVFESLAQKANAYRHEALERAQGPIEDPRAFLETLIGAFVDPYLGEGSEVSGRLLARFFLRHRLHPTAGTQWITETYHNPIATEYIAAIARACPHIEKNEIFWRYIFMVNTLIVSSADVTSFDRLAVLSEGALSNTTNAERRAALIRYFVSAFLSP